MPCVWQHVLCITFVCKRAAFGFAALLRRTERMVYLRAEQLIGSSRARSTPRISCPSGSSSSYRSWRATGPSSRYPGRAAESVLSLLAMAMSCIHISEWQDMNKHCETWKVHGLTSKRWAHLNAAICQDLEELDQMITESACSRHIKEGLATFAAASYEQF